MSCSYWKEYRLEDICENIFSGGTPSTKNTNYWNGNIPWLSSGETRNNFINSTEKTITLDAVNNSSTKLAKKGDIVIASAGQGYTRGQTSFCNIDTYINQSLIAIRTNNDKIHNKYLYYNLKGRYDELRQLSDGHSIRGSLTTKIIKDLVIKLPPLKEQKKIANILFSLDDKIGLNNEMNKTLEEMAQSIFKRWFVDFEFPNDYGEPYKSSGGEMVESEVGMIPKGWEVRSLYDLAEYINGTSFKSKDYVENGLPIIKIAELKSGITGSTKFFNGEKDKKFYIKNRDILFSWSGNPDTSIDTFIWYKGDAILNQHIFKVIPKVDYEYSFIYLLLKYLKNTFMNIARNKQTTGLGHVTVKDLKTLKVVINSEKIRLFSSIVMPMLEKIIDNYTNLEILLNLRDTLLPKLISGKIKVD
ncbi:restriction endonuclease subunit S [Intestinibacter bartlettii]|uniref:restriction endonuclease subunit S n=1 Tax=Intestinibacter bartlettii TaxID=261299 RepID=UPI0032195B89